MLDMDPDEIPETMEEAEMFMDTNIKTDAEVAAQVATNMTLSWANFNDTTFRRAVKDLVALGMAWSKEATTPTKASSVEYVDPVHFVHSYTEDPNFGDIVYAGHIKRIPIQELKRLAGDSLQRRSTRRSQTRSRTSTTTTPLDSTRHTTTTDTHRTIYGYDEYMVEVLDFEFISIDTMHFEEKESRFGNIGFYFKGMKHKAKNNGVFDRKPHKMDVACVYSGSFYDWHGICVRIREETNMPKNLHDLSRAELSYSVVATNIRRMMPKSLVESCTGFADMLQLTHLKIQQAIAKAKPDGLIIDIEGLENVQLGKGGELEPLEIHDIYEQTGVFYYRSKNPEGGFQNPPVREIGNQIRNIQELVALYNHYLQLIRDTSGINESMDGTTPKGEMLVGVQQNAIAQGNNALYDITHSSMLLYKRVCSDVVKCLQIVPAESVLYRIYENAIGETNMGVLNSFRNLSMYNFGVKVVKEMEDKDREFLEQNIQMAIQQGQIDLEDAMAVRSLKDVNQAERLLIIRRKKRMQEQQQMAAQNSQMQAQQAQQAAMAASQAKQQELQMESQLKQQEIQLKGQMDMQLMQLEHQMRKEIEMIKAQATLGFREDDQNFKEKLEVMKEDRKDNRLTQEQVQSNQQEEDVNINELPQ